jgi:hypothetical protein
MIRKDRNEECVSSMVTHDNKRAATGEHPLNYARPLISISRIGLAIISAAAVLVCGVLTLWSGAHTLYVSALFDQHSHDVCNDWSQRIDLGIPGEQTLGLCLFFAGCTLVAGIQLIRQINSAQSRR